jgi:hypothetical protein
MSRGGAAKAMAEAEAETGAALVLAADDAESLARFYASLLGQPPCQGSHPRHWRVAWPAGGWLEIYVPSRSRPRPRRQGRLALCLSRCFAGDHPMAHLASWVEGARKHGATLLEPPRLEPFGAEAWLADPEGNPFLLLVN